MTKIRVGNFLRTDLILQFSQLLFALFASFLVMLFCIISQLLHIRLNLCRMTNNHISIAQLLQWHPLDGRGKKICKWFQWFFHVYSFRLFGKHLHNTMNKRRENAEVYRLCMLCTVSRINWLKDASQTLIQFHGMQATCGKSSLHLRGCSLYDRPWRHDRIGKSTS